MRAPHYETISRQSDRQFKSTVTVGDKQYSSSLWCKNKKLAEQSAATVCLRAMKFLSNATHEQDSQLATCTKQNTS